MSHNHERSEPPAARAPGDEHNEATAQANGDVRRRDARSASEMPAEPPRRRAILDAAATVLSTSGYSGATQTNIAAETGIQAASLYHYFPSKESLVEEVLTQAVRQSRLDIERALTDLPPSAGPDERLTVAVKTMMIGALDRRTYAAAHLRCAGQIPDGLMPRLLAEVRLMNEMWQQLVVAALASRTGVVTKNPAIVRLLIMGAISWSVDWPAYARTAPEDAAQILVELLMHGLGEPEP